jgi:hypothetical protein
MKTLGSEGTAPPFLPSALDGDEVSFMPWPLCPHGKGLRYPFVRLDGPQSWPGCDGGEKNLAPAKN